jgi:LuxR family maltose regulon positive regulatory protein
LELVESKLHPPPARPGIVARALLVDRLLASAGVPVVCVVAPAGYGKTTLLAQWAEREPRPVAWVAVDQRDNDPALLLTYLAVALDRVEPIDPRIVRGLPGPGASIVDMVPRLAAAMAAMTQPVALVLDHVELLGNQQSLDLVAELAAQLPAGAQLLMASRAPPPLPVPLLRAQGRVVELGVEELAMDHQEARALLEGAGGGGVDRLLQAAKANAAVGEAGDGVDQVAQGAAEAVQLPHDQGVAGAQLVRHLLQDRAIGGGAAGGLDNTR